MGSVMLWETFYCHGLGSLVPLERILSANQYKAILTENHYLMMKRFHPDGSCLVQVDPASMHRARVLTESFSL